MKKTMFITSVIMVVVMAIALTTSSLAWFTAAGSSVVTTNQMTVKATADAASGIQISSVSGDEAFGNTINLDNAEAMKPLVPIGANSAGVIASLASPSTGSATNDVGFVGNFTITLHDISGQTENEIVYFAGANATVDGESQAYYAGYYEDDLWIRNIGTAACKVTPTIEFYKNTSTTSTPSYTAYTSTAVPGTDPILNVAVLAYEKTSADAASATWNLVQLFSTSVAYSATATSSRILTSVNAAATGASLAPGVAVSGATSSVNPAKINSGASVTDGLAPVDTAANGNLTYHAIQFRVIAWYDGEYLNRSTVGAADYQFKLTFTKS